MQLEALKHSLAVLKGALPAGAELGMPWPQDPGFDDYESSGLIHAAVQQLGGQTFLAGNAAEVEAFLDQARQIAEPRVIGFWLRYSTFFADDGGAGLQRLVSGWQSSPDSLKLYLAQHAADLVETGAPD